MRLLHVREVYKYTKYAHVIYRPPKTEIGATGREQQRRVLKLAKEHPKGQMGAMKEGMQYP
jgi:hypothetical protein